ncbi:hypothetical protein [Parvibaculum sp.]
MLKFGGHCYSRATIDIWDVARARVSAVPLARGDALRRRIKSIVLKNEN